MAGLSSVFSNATALLGSWFVWLGIAVLIVVFIFGFIYARRKSKFKFPCLIFNDIGAGKVGIQKTKCGWFMSKKIGKFFEVGGERRLETEDGRIIRLAGTDNFHEINFKRGIICVAKADDPKVLLPINSVILKNSEMLQQIASADYREVGAQLYQENKKEGLGLLDKILPVVGIVLACVILMIVVIYFGQTIKEIVSDIKVMHTESLASNERIANLLTATPSTSGAK